MKNRKKGGFVGLVFWAGFFVPTLGHTESMNRTYRLERLLDLTGDGSDRREGGLSQH